MTDNDNPFDDIYGRLTRKPVPGKAPSRVRKAGVEDRIAEKEASDEWVHVNDLHDLVERWRRWAEQSDGDRPDHWGSGYNAALRVCAEELDSTSEYAHEHRGPPNCQDPDCFRPSEAPDWVYCGQHRQ